MADQEKTKKSHQPAIGGIGRQYATIGGGKRIPESQNVQTTEGSNVETLEQPDVEATKPSSDKTLEHLNNRETSQRPDVQTSSTPSTRKNEKNERSRQTVYLEPDVDEWIRNRINSERKRLKRRVEISEVVNEAVRYYQENNRT